MCRSIVVVISIFRHTSLDVRHISCDGLDISAEDGKILHLLDKSDRIKLGFQVVK